ncbi:PXA domain-containing protein [Infundibulicybe gibba]|nr:PXA domain-containing protein [Infundibulicybe gibba]
MSIHRPVQQPSIASTRQNQPSLAKRLLFPNSQSQELPKLLLSPHAPSELTSELYDFIALALRAFVNPWWSRISRYDKEFLPEISKILTVVIQALETRVAQADLASVVFSDLPNIVTQHYRDYRNAESKISTSYATGGATSLPQLFHHIQPHLAISSDGKLDREYFRQVFDVVLKHCLPSEDFNPEPERFIIREVMLKVFLDDVMPKIIQPWFIQKTILDLLGSVEDPLRLEPPEPISRPSFSFHNLIVLILSAIQALSGICLTLIQAYKQTFHTIKLVNQSKPIAPPPKSPFEVAPSLSPSLSTSSSSSSVIQPTTIVSNQPRHALPFIAMINEVFSTQDRLAASTITNTLTILTTSLTPFIDRLLPHMLSSTLSPALILTMTRTAKRTLFPNGYPGLQPPDPTPEEQAEVRARLVAWRGRGMLCHTLPFLLGPDPSLTLGAALDPLSSPECNIHLVVIIIDRILALLFPELCSGGSLP